MTPSGPLMLSAKGYAQTVRGLLHAVRPWSAASASVDILNRERWGT